MAGNERVAARLRGGGLRWEYELLHVHSSAIRSFSARPAELCTLFVLSSAGLAKSGRFVVLCTSRWTVAEARPTAGGLRNDR
jgi:hypothetical protein